MAAVPYAISAIIGVTYPYKLPEDPIPSDYSSQTSDFRNFYVSGARDTSVVGIYDSEVS